MCECLLTLSAVIDLFQRMASVFCVIAITILAASLRTLAHYPFHASCNVDW